MNKSDEILYEWSHQLPASYPKTNSDYEVLEMILRTQYDISGNDLKALVEKSRADKQNEKFSAILEQRDVTDYDAAIRQRLQLEPDQDIPAVTGNYTLTPGTLILHPNDETIFQNLWPETMNQAVIGKGEIAIYWLYKYQQPSMDVIDNRGEDQPDLLINDNNVEVKSYPSHNARITLGRLQKFKETRKIISVLFSIHTLIGMLSDNKREVYSDLAFKSEELINSFKTFKELDSLLGRDELIQMFPIFKNLYDQISSVKTILGLNEDYDPSDGAYAILIKLLREKLHIKPGDSGYIINVRSKDIKDIYIYRVDFESLDKERVLNNVVVNGGTIETNYKNIFG